MKYIYLIAGILNLIDLMKLIINGHYPHKLTVILWGVLFVLFAIGMFYHKRRMEKFEKNFKNILTDDKLTDDEKSTKIASELKKLAQRSKDE